jgi:hypothetical protein
MSQPQSPLHSGAPTRAAARPTGADAALLDADLGGDLPCVQCKYNLRGLSILGQCPECNTPVRATLVAVVDPLASEFQPIARPWLVAAGLVAWSVGLLGATASACAWMLLAPRAVPGGPLAPWGFFAMLAPVVAGVSGIGACALVRPHDGIPPRERVAALVGVLCYIPAVVLLLWVQSMPVQGGGAYLWWFAARGGEQVVGIAGVVILTMLSLVLLRPNARRLAARSLLLRTGRADRQTLRTLAGVLSAVVVGHALGVAAAMQSPAWDVVALVAGLINAAGYAFFMVGMVGVVIDCVRIAGVVARPPLGLEAIIAVRGAAETQPPTRRGTRERTKSAYVERPSAIQTLDEQNGERDKAPPSEDGR